MNINFAVLTSRTDVAPSQHTTSVQQFYDTYIAKPRKTAETMKQYFESSKEQQAHIKDVGGYIMGDTKGRKAVTRSCVTLDADHCQPDFLSNFKPKHQVILHTTRKHTATSPRYRIIVPLSRAVSRDEYEPLSRLIAYSFGMDNFDQLTHQVDRLMYFPSVSRDCKTYETTWYNGLPILDVDRALATYADYKDATQWYVHKGERLAPKQNKQVADAHNKPGVIGIFNRLYSIDDVMDMFLSDVYVAAGNRYALVGASSTPGVVVYDDKYVYSNHANDKANTGHILNAYDLVRVHKFDGDERKMKVWVASLEQVQQQLRDETLSMLKTDTTVLDASDEYEGYDYERDLAFDKQGNLVCTHSVLIALLCLDNALADGFKFNAMTQRIDVSVNPLVIPNRSVFNDAVLLEVAHYLGNKYFKTKGVSKEKVYDAIMTVADRSIYNPLIDKIESFVWDRTPRAETLFIDYLGADDTPYVRAATRVWLTGAIKRMYEPGCKFDLMLILEGGQGVGKSTIIRNLSWGYYTDGLSSFAAREAVEMLEGQWLVELAELAALNRSDEETLKAFITKQTDSTRKAYARVRSDEPRRCVFAGTSNTSELFRDVTGSRRFLPITVKEQMQPMDKEFGFFDEYTLGQIWAEVRDWYAHGEPTHLSGEMKDIATKHNQQYAELSNLHDQIAEWCDTLVPDDYYSLSDAEQQQYDIGAKHVKVGVTRTRIKVTQVWAAMGRDLLQLTKAQKNAIGMSLVTLGYTPKSYKVHGKTVRGYVRA